MNTSFVVVIKDFILPLLLKQLAKSGVIFAIVSVSAVPRPDAVYIKGNSSALVWNM